MGRYVIKVPDIGEGMTEAEIVAWHVAPGQVIREEDPLVDVMTDKATVELPAPVAGTVVAIHGTPGEKRPVGSELVELDVVGAGNAPERPHPPAAKAAGPPSPAGRERASLPAVFSDAMPQAGEAVEEREKPALSPLSRTAGAGGERSEPGEGLW